MIIMTGNEEAHCLAKDLFKIYPYIQVIHFNNILVGSPTLISAHCAVYPPRYMKALFLRKSHLCQETWFLIYMIQNLNCKFLALLTCYQVEMHAASIACECTEVLGSCNFRYTWRTYLVRNHPWHILSKQNLQPHPPIAVPVVLGVLVFQYPYNISTSLLHPFYTCFTDVRTSRTRLPRDTFGFIEICVILPNSRMW